MPKLRVAVTGLQRASRIPGWLEEGQQRTLDLAGSRLRDAIRAASPGGKVAADVNWRVLSSNRGVLESFMPWTRALDRGAYIRSKRGRGTAIRFNAGGRTVFMRAPRGSRLKARHFYTKGLRFRRKIVQGAFNEAMGSLG